MINLSLQLLPDKWTMLKKKVMIAKQAVIPLQQNQVAKIRRKTISFDVKQHEYREKFRKCPAFFYNCQNPYRIMNQVRFFTFNSIIFSAFLRYNFFPDIFNHNFVYLYILLFDFIKTISLFNKHCCFCVFFNKKRRW